MVIKTASPGVIVNEVDLTRGTSDAITTNVGGFVGPFARGPVDELTLIETEAELRLVFTRGCVGRVEGSVRRLQREPRL